ncbi:MAG: hypothetical protein ACOY5H_02915 [Pseudomonadota bacterium]
MNMSGTPQTTASYRVVMAVAWVNGNDDGHHLTWSGAKPTFMPNVGIF